LARVGVPADVVGALLYLSSDHADYVTGATLDVNGGLFMA
jgi:NAD(P)-dependent dehydrogenase (short-subunit alcohol dehydrogenase family)